MEHASSLLTPSYLFHPVFLYCVQNQQMVASLKEVKEITIGTTVTFQRAVWVIGEGLITVMQQRN